MHIIMSGRRHQLSLVAALCVVGTHPLPSSSLSSSSVEVGFYDDLRSASPEEVDVKIQRGSEVVSVTHVGDATRFQARSEEDDPRSSNNTSSSSFRLCHLTSMLPLSDGRGNTIGPMNTAGAALLAVQNFNLRRATVVPDLEADPALRDCDVRLTLDSRDTEWSPIAANRALLDATPSWRTHGLRTPRPCAIVGASRSSVSGPLSIMASVHNVPVVSYLSSSSQLDNKGIYRLFGRTTPTDECRATAAVGYLRDVLHVTHVGVLYVRDEWGTAFHVAFLRAAFALDPPMKVVSASYDYFQEDDQGDQRAIEGAIDQLEASGYNYFFALMQNLQYDRVMNVARGRGLVGPGKFWLFGEMLPGEHVADHGVAVMDLVFERNDAFDEEWRSFREDDSIKEYFGSKQPTNLDMANFTFFPSPTYWEYLEYDAVMALGIAACQARGEFFRGDELFDSFTKTSFEGASGSVSFDPTTGTRAAGGMSYKVSNVVLNRGPGTKDETNAATTGSGPGRSLVEVARQVKTDGGGNGGDGESMRWITVGPTVYADGGNVAPPVLPSKEEVRHMIGPECIALGLTLAGLVMVMSLIWALWTVVNRNAHVVRSSQPQFLLMICMGTFIIACSVVPLSLQEPVDPLFLDVACMAFPWFFSLGWVVTLSAIFSKTLRIYKLIKRSQKFCRVTVKSEDVLRPFLALFTLNMILLISWTAISPLRWTRIDVVSSVDKFGRINSSYATCATEPGRSEWPFVILLFALHFTYLLYAIFVGYRARHIATEYNETYYIAISAVSILQAFLVGVPVLAVAGQDPEANYVIRSILVTLVCGAVLIPLFIPKVKARRRERRYRKIRLLLRAEREKLLVLNRRNRRLKEERRRIRNRRLFATRSEPACKKIFVAASSSTDTDLSSSMSIFLGTHIDVDDSDLSAHCGHTQIMASSA